MYNDFSNQHYTFTKERNAMNLQKYFNRKDKNTQDISDNWDKIILPKLPKNLDEIARKEGAIIRKRGLRSATGLLKILFLYACCNLSFRILAAASCALGIADISDTAWRKRFAKSVPFLRGVLQSMLSTLIPAAGASAFAGVKNVLLVDASTIRQEGAQQFQQRIHLCYSLNENRMKQVKVTDKHTAELLSHFEFKPGDLVMADAGYGTARNYIYAREQGAEAILRISPNNFCLYTADGEKIQLQDMLENAEKQHAEWVDTFGFCRYGKKSAFVRVIANRLPEGQAEKARKRTKRRASKNQQKIRQGTLLYAGWVIFITSLGAEYSGEEIVYLYKSRWQVELLFKRFKQNLSITTLKAGSAAYAEAQVLLWLAIWTAVERQAFLAECHLAEKEECAYSTYTLSKISFLQITEALRLSWALFIDLTDEKYARFITEKERHRMNQNKEFHCAILPGLLA